MCTITQAELEATDRHGQTPLNLAARHGYADVVRVLLAAGASADHADCDGWTALRAAAWGGHTQVNASGKVLSRLLAYRKWPQTVSRKPDIILGTPPSPPIKSARHLDKKLTRTQNAVATLIILINHLSIIISFFSLIISLVSVPSGCLSWKLHTFVVFHFVFLMLSFRRVYFNWKELLF